MSNSKTTLGRRPRNQAWVLLVVLVSNPAALAGSGLEVPPLPARSSANPPGERSSSRDMRRALDLVDPGAPAQGETAAPVDQAIEQAACASCGGLHGHVSGTAFGPSGCAAGACIPGRPPCNVPPEPCTFLGRAWANLYECLCCPDPCYQPKWVPAANASFFTDFARPRTVTRIRFDRGLDMQFPDRNQYFMKTIYSKKFTGKGLVPFTDPRLSLNYSQLTFYQEAASERASLFFEMPYRQIDPLFGNSSAGFADLNFGSKALLFDCEMLQVTFQFRTFMPSGNSRQGLGTGHISLEPSLLASLRLAENTYFQGQLAQWIPLGGTNKIAGGILHYHFSFNQVLWNYTPDSPLIGTFEMNGYSFQNGGYTGPVLSNGGKTLSFATVGNSGDTYFDMGPGLRKSICNRVDFGGALAWAVTSPHFASPIFRLEVRFLF